MKRSKLIEFLKKRDNKELLQDDGMAMGDVGMSVGGGEGAPLADTLNGPIQYGDHVLYNTWHGPSKKKKKKKKKKKN